MDMTVCATCRAASVEKSSRKMTPIASLRRNSGELFIYHRVCVCVCMRVCKSENTNANQSVNQSH